MDFGAHRTLGRIKGRIDSKKARAVLLLGLFVRLQVSLKELSHRYSASPNSGKMNLTTSEARIREKMIRSTHTIKISFSEISMSVPRMQGMEAEKNRISETQTMATPYTSSKYGMARM